MKTVVSPILRWIGLLGLIAAFLGSWFVWQRYLSPDRGLEELGEPLRKASGFVLYSLAPFPRNFYEREGKEVPEEELHGYPVYGSVTISDKGEREMIIEAVRASALANNGSIAACFNPRHGIRVPYGEGFLDILICFQCRRLRAIGFEERYSLAISMV